MSQDPRMANQGYGGYPPPGMDQGYPFQPGYGQHQAGFPPQPPVPPAFGRPTFPKDDTEAAGAGAGEWGNFSGLDSKEIRRVFIRKVYSILFVQLMVTFGLIAIFHFTPKIREYVRSSDGIWAYYASYVVFLVTYLALACCKNAGRRFPLNLILLGFLTLSMGYMMGMISAYYKIESVLLAVGITAFVCLGVTIFSFQTKYDFTSCVGVMFVVSLALLGFGIICLISQSYIMYKVYAGLGAVVFTIFLAIDTQLIVGGKKHEISAEDHIFAAVMLYLDVVYIFMYILSLLGSRE